MTLTVGTIAKLLGKHVTQTLLGKDLAGELGTLAAEAGIDLADAKFKNLNGDASALATRAVGTVRAGMEGWPRGSGGGRTGAGIGADRGGGCAGECGP